MKAQPDAEADADMERQEAAWKRLLRLMAGKGKRKKKRG